MNWREIPSLLRRMLQRQDESGSATVEFVCLGVMTLVPLMYVALAFLEVERNGFAVTQAAREAGRAFAISNDLDTGVHRAMYAVRLAIEDQGLDGGNTQLRFVAQDAPCDSGTPAPAIGAATLRPGAKFAVCVTRVYYLPGVPTLFTGRENNSITGRFLVDVEEIRAKAEKARDKS